MPRFVYFFLTWLTSRTCTSPMQDIGVMPPRLISYAEQQEVMYTLGATVALPCRVAVLDNTTVDYVWTKDGDALVTDGYWIRFESYSLIIDGASEIDQGLYQCHARTPYGTCLTTVTTLRLAVATSYSEQESSSIGVYSAAWGEGVKLNYLPTNVYPYPPTWTWEIVRDSVTRTEQIVLNERLAMDSHGHLHFSYVLPKDQTRYELYRCTIRNTYTGQAVSGSNSRLTVTGKYPTEFAPSLAFSSAETVIALLHQQITLRCFFYGYPEVRITWTRADGQDINYRRTYFKYGSFILTIWDIRQYDAGVYTCTGRNSVNTTQYQIQLLVHSRPVFLPGGMPVNVNATIGDNVTFRCLTEALPAAKTQWFINGQPRTGDEPPRTSLSENGQELSVQRVCKQCEDERDTDLMVVQCNASNEHGYVFEQAYLNVLERTTITALTSKHVIVTKIPHQIDLDCEVKVDPLTPALITWAHNSHKIENSNLFRVRKSLLTVVIRNMDDCTKLVGNYTCEANNGYTIDRRTLFVDVHMQIPSTTATATLVVDDDVAIEDYWWVFPLSILILTPLFIASCLLCYFCLMKESPAPTKEVDLMDAPADGEFIRYERPCDSLTFKTDINEFYSGDIGGDQEVIATKRASDDSSYMHGDSDIELKRILRG